MSLFPVLIDWNCVETVLFELMITCTGRWLAYFVILFLYTRLLSLPRLLSTGLLLLLRKSYMQFCASMKRLALTESFIFWRFKNLDFLYFAVSVSCFNRLRLWWNCAFWIDDNMHWALIALFCDTLCVYKTLESSAVALDWLATSAFKKLYAILWLMETLGFDWVFVFLET